MNSNEILVMAENALNTIRPAMEADGGGVKITGYNSEDGILSISFIGACIHCPSQKLTFSFGIEKILKEKLPTLKQINILK